MLLNRVMQLFRCNLELPGGIITPSWKQKRMDARMPEQFIARQRLYKHIPAEAKAGNNGRAMFSVVSARCYATVRQTYLYSSESTRNNTGSDVFCGGRLDAIQRGSHTARMRIEIVGCCCQKNWVAFRSWQLQQRIEGACGARNWQKKWKERN
jgi:hypothetical protein